MLDTEERTREVQARKRAKDFTGLLWHAGTFVIVSSFFLILDGLSAGGLTWAPWITLVWGVGLAFHALAYWINGAQVEDRKTRQYTDEMR